MQSGDRYAALKDLDEQFRESKDKDNANTLFSNTTIDNAFGFGGNPQMSTNTMSNPFQAIQPNAINGFATNQFPVMFTNTSPNMLGSQIPGSVMMNGNHFMTNGNGGAQQSYPNTFMHPNASVTNNNFTQRNPFAVSNAINITNKLFINGLFVFVSLQAPVLNSATNPFL